MQARATNNPKRVNTDNPFGVLEFLHWDYPWSNYKYADKRDLKRAIDLMREAMVGWVRMDFIWEDIEPAPGEFKFDKYDHIVELAFGNGIEILGILDYSAAWASSAGRWNNPPKDNDLFIRYASSVVRRYKDKVKYWEIWNEPDSPIYWTEQDGLRRYCLLLKDSYIAMKQTDPDCIVLNGGLANGSASVRQLYDHSVKDYFDILNIHIFDSPLNSGAIERAVAYPELAYKIMVENGDSRKKIWITETGCPGIRGGSKINQWWLGENPDELKQAEWIEDIFTGLSGSKNIEKIFWAFLRDCNGHWDNGVDYFGLLRWDFSKKPAFFACRRCAQGFSAYRQK